MKKKTAKLAARKPAAGKTATAGPGKLTGIKRKLLEMRDDLIRTVRTQQLEESAEQDTGDDADKASQSIEKELLFELSDNERMTLDHIEAALRKIDYRGWTSVFMHPTPRGIPILPTAGEVTAAVNQSRRYLADCLAKS